MPTKWRHGGVHTYSIFQQVRCLRLDAIRVASGGRREEKIRQESQLLTDTMCMCLTLMRPLAKDLRTVMITANQGRAWWHVIRISDARVLFSRQKIKRSWSVIVSSMTTPNRLKTVFLFIYFMSLIDMQVKHLVFTDWPDNNALIIVGQARKSQICPCSVKF